MSVNRNVTVPVGGVIELDIGGILQRIGDSLFHAHSPTLLACSLEILLPKQGAGRLYSLLVYNAILGFQHSANGLQQPFCCPQQYGPSLYLCPCLCQLLSSCHCHPS